MEMGTWSGWVKCDHQRCTPFEGDRLQETFDVLLGWVEIADVLQKAKCEPWGNVLTSNCVCAGGR